MHELTFHAGIHAVEDGRIATFYLMNTGVNRNRWGVTDQALEHALPTILGKPIGCGPDHVIDRHYRNFLKVGEFTGTSKPDGYALGTIEVTDPVVWEHLSEGEWGPISVVITSYLERCSNCGDDLTGLSDPFAHECVQAGLGFVQVESFVFDRVDFIESPAYPQAGLMRAGGSEVVSLELLAGFYSSQIGLDRVSGPVAPGGVNPELRLKKLKEAEYLVQVSQLQQRCAQLEKEKQSLESTVNNLESERHTELLEETVDARFVAGLTANKEQERKRLAELDTEVLVIMKEDAGKAMHGTGSPKAKFSRPRSGSLGEAMEDTRFRLFGYRREADA